LYSEEDIPSVKASLYFLKVLVMYAKSRLHSDLFKLVIKLVLFCTTRVLCNVNCSEKDTEEVKTKVESMLKVFVQRGTTTICDISIFNVRDKDKRLLESKVQYIL